METSEELKQIKDKILKVETLKTGPQQKAELILVLLGEKPGIGLSLFVDKENEIDEDEEKIRSLNLKYKKVKQEKRGKRYMAEFLISQSEDTLNELTESDPSKDHYRYGSLMGYPESAIKAFLEGTCLNIDDERELLSKYPEIVFNDFRLSRDHNKEELELVRRWNNLVEKEAPNIYNELKPSSTHS
ncbi:MAG: hypothetical protein ACOYL8_04705 [Patescibacteria group bacterium]